jgi:hypothetical protein
MKDEASDGGGGMSGLTLRTDGPRESGRDEVEG